MKRKQPDSMDNAKGRLLKRLAFKPGILLTTKQEGRERKTFAPDPNMTGNPPPRLETTSRVLMIRPANFAYNYETSLTNAFQRLQDDNDENVHEKAVAQFQGLVDLLRANGVDVTVIQDTPLPHTPESLFPNNWISFYEDNNGTICLHPMYAVNRRAERKQHVINVLHAKFRISDSVNLAHYEQAEEFLEGTGSIVLDRKARFAYACHSARTHKGVFDRFCAIMGFQGIFFYATDSHGRAIYHTNVMMSVADKYAVLCLEAIRRDSDRVQVVQALEASGKEVIVIDMGQMCRFAGNCLQLQNGRTGEKMLFMSSQAYRSLRAEQIEKITKYNRILHTEVDIIEINGGGSVRCMIAEIFLPRK